MSSRGVDLINEFIFGINKINLDQEVSFNFCSYPKNKEPLRSE